MKKSLAMEEQITKEQSKVPVLELEYSFSQLLGDIREESYHLCIDVKIFFGGCRGYYGSYSEDGPRRQIGEALLKLYNWERAARHNDVWTTGGLGSDKNDLVEVFIDPRTGNPLPEWEQEFAICRNKNILYVDILRLDPEYRHQAWGAYVLKSIYDTFDGMFGLMVLYLYPMQHYPFALSEWDKDIFKANDLGWDFNEAKAKLVNYYELLGFKVIKDSGIAPPYMYLNAYRHNKLMEGIDIYVYWDY